MKINTISSTNESFPKRLRSLYKCPAQLYCLGDLPVYSLGIAIVGTRKPTSYGRHVTAELAGKLADRGAVIISGLAHGIDGIAHEAVVRSGGKTIAVLASGLDNISPTAHRSLAAQIVDHSGAIVSEYEPGTPPLQYRFLERNRIVSGLADMIIVTEASARSGTMNTVSHALEQGKEVYAVPGPITSAMSSGCNTLISQGATPIVSIDQFLDELYPRASQKQAALLAQNVQEQLILDLLATGISDGDELQTKSRIDPNLYMQTMTMLEIRGVIRPLGANRWSL